MLDLDARHLIHGTMKFRQNQASEPIKGIIFDKDGTLADARPFLRRLAIARAQACAERFFRQSPDQTQNFFDSLSKAFGVTSAGLDPDGLMAVGTRPANEQAAIRLARAMGVAEAEATRLVPHIFTAVDGLVTCKAAQTPPFSGIQAMLLWLGDSPFKVGVLSSDSTANVADFIDYYDVNHRLDSFRGTEPGDNPKPHPELFWELCNLLGIHPHQALMVGDSWADLEVTRNAGAAAFVSVGTAWGRSPIPGADFVIKSWDDLLHLVSSFDRDSSPLYYPAEEIG